MKSPYPWIVSAIFALIAVISWGAFIFAPDSSEGPEVVSTDIEVLNERVDQISAQNEQLEVQIAKVTDERNNLQVKIEELSSLTTEFDGLTVLNEDLRKKLNEADENNTELIQEIETLQATINAVSSTESVQSTDTVTEVVTTASETAQNEPVIEVASTSSETAQVDSVTKLVAKPTINTITKPEFPEPLEDWQYSTLSEQPKYLEDMLAYSRRQLRKLRQEKRALIEQRDALLIDKNQVENSQQVELVNSLEEWRYTALSKDPKYLEDVLAFTRNQLRKSRQKSRALIEQRDALLIDKNQVKNSQQVELVKNKDVTQKIELLDAENAAWESVALQYSNQSKELQSQVAMVEVENSRLVEQLNELNEDITELQLDNSVKISDLKHQIKQREDQLLIITIASDILFDSGSAALTAEGKNALRVVFDQLIVDTDRIVSLEGHTDSVPVSERLTHIYPTNWELSGARAATAARLLIANGLPQDKVLVSAFGATKPIADNDTEAGRQMNRRLEIHLRPNLDKFQKANGN